MKFNPEKIDLIPEGNYKFLVADSKEETSKSGNEQIKVRLTILDENNIKLGNVFDYFLAQYPKKLGKFALSIGLESKYDLGEIDASECMSREGRLSVTIQKDETGQYPDKNVVKSYLKPAGESLTDSDVPF